MKNFLLYLSVIATLLISSVSCATDEPVVEECPLEHMPTEVPTLAIEVMDVTATDISFKLTPTDAASVRYTICEASKSAPTAEALFDKSSEYYGSIADATIVEEYSFSELAINTDYVIYAAAKNNIGFSELQSLAVKTLIPEVVFGVNLTQIKSSTIKFEVELKNVGKAAYMVYDAAATPDAADVLANGVEMSAEDGKCEYTVSDLTASTAYQLVVVVTDLTMGNAVAENVEFTTAEQPAPCVGDFYYADGTWSSELKAEANPIGIVFCVRQHPEDTSNYMLKDGATKLEEFHGYVVAAYDATYDAATGSNNGVAWGWQTGWMDDANGTSTSTQDFLGYSNSMEVLADANGVLTDSSSDNYPAFYYAMVKQEELYPAPESSTGWFLPSAYQLLYIWDTFDPESEEDALIENKLAELEAVGLGAKMYVRDSEYWSSTERSGSAENYAHYVVFDTASLNPGYIDYWTKSYKMRVRSMLVF